jgi:hypothetical protein
MANFFVDLVPRNLKAFADSIKTMVDPVMEFKQGAKGASGMEGVQSLMQQNNLMSLKSLGMLAGILGVVGIVASVISGLQPIMSILDMISNILTLFLMPFALMAMKLMQPVLISLLRLMPLWLEFWKDPVSGLKGLMTNSFNENLGGLSEAVSGGDWTTAGSIFGLAAVSNFMRMFNIDKVFNVVEWLAGLDWVSLGVLFGTSAIAVFSKLFHLDLALKIAEWIAGLNLSQRIWSALQKAWTWTLDFGSKVWDAVLEVWNFGLDLADKVWSTFASIWKWELDIAQSVWSMFSNIWIWSLDLAGNIWSKIASTWTWSLDLGKKLWGWVKDRLDNYSFLSGGQTESLQDFIISGGKVYQTSPQDTIIGKKDWSQGVGSSGGGKSIQVLNPQFHIHIQGGMDRQFYDKIFQEMSSRLAQLGV